MADDRIPYNSQSTLTIYKMLVGDAQETNLTIAARVKHNQLNIAIYLVFYQYHAFNFTGFSFNSLWLTTKCVLLTPGIVTPRGQAKLRNLGSVPTVDCNSPGVCPLTCKPD